MANESQYKEALIKAHNAGDFDAATLFSEKIKELRGAAKTARPIPSGRAPEAPTLSPSASFAQFGTAPTYEEGLHLSPEEKRLKELPEIGRFEEEGEGAISLPSKRQLGIASRILLIADDQERAESFKELGFKIKNVGDYQVATDESGREFVVNAPGMSRQDLLSISSQIAQYLPAGRIAGGMSTLGKKIIAGAIGAGVTSAGQEALQTTVGGEFDGQDVAINTILGGGAELLIPVLGAAYRKISPAAKKKFRQAETIKDLMEVEGLDLKALDNALSVQEDLAIEAARLDVQAPSAPQVLGEAGSVTAPEAAMVGARGSVKTSKELAEQQATQAQELRGAAERVFSQITEEGALGALQGTKKTAEEILQSTVNQRKAFADVMYDDAFKGVEDIPVEDIREGITKIIKEETNPGSAAEKALSKIFKQLESREVIEAKRLAKDTPKILDASGKEVKTQLPPSAKSPRLMQEAIWDMRDLLGIQNEKSVTKSVKAKIKTLEKQLAKRLDDSTGGKYKAADEKFSQMSDSLDGLLKSMVGKAAGAEEMTLSTILDAVFSPKPAVQELSQKFMKQLASENPQAAADLYGTYFVSNVKNLSDDAKPSEILKSVFGKDEQAKRMAISLAPDAKTKRNLLGLEKLLKAAQRTEAFSVDDAVSKWSQNKLDSAAAHWFYIGRGLERTFGKRKAKRVSEALSEAATNPEWEQEWAKLLESKTVLDRAKKLSSRDRMKAAEDVEERAVILFERIKDSISPVSKAKALAPVAGARLKESVENKMESDPRLQQTQF